MTKVTAGLFDLEMIAKFHDLLQGGGLTVSDLDIAIDDLSFRKNLIRFWQMRADSAHFPGLNRATISTPSRRSQSKLSIADSINKIWDLHKVLMQDGLTEEDLQEVISDSVFRSSLIVFWMQRGEIPIDDIRKYEETASQNRARMIMGEAFWGIAEVANACGVEFNQAQLATLAQIPFSADVLEECKDTHILCPFPGLSLNEIDKIAVRFGVNPERTAVFEESDIREQARRSLDTAWLLIARHYATDKVRPQGMRIPPRSFWPSDNQFFFTAVLSFLLGREGFTDYRNFLTNTNANGHFLSFHCSYSRDAIEHVSVYWVIGEKETARQGYAHARLPDK